MAITLSGSLPNVRTLVMGFSGLRSRSTMGSKVQLMPAAAPSRAATSPRWYSCSGSPVAAAPMGLAT